MKKQDVISIINALAPIKISKIEKDLRGKILKNNFQLQKVSKDIEDFVEQSKKSLFADMQEEIEKVTQIREKVKGDKEKMIQAEMQIKNDYPHFSEQEGVLNQTYLAMLQEDVTIPFEYFTEEEIVSIYGASEIDLTMTDLNILSNILTNKN